MNASQKSEALRLADKYEAQGFLGDHSFAKEQWCSQAAVELRRLHARIADLEAQLADETEAADNWRRLALQFDNHRMQALGHLKAILHSDSSVDEYKAAELFLKAPPLDGEEVLAQRIAELATKPAAVDMGIPMTGSSAPKMRPEAWLATFRPKGMLSPHSIAGVNLEELKRQVPSDSVFKPLYTRHTSQELEQFIEQVGDVHFQRCRVGSREGAIRWYIEFWHYGAEVRGKTLREAITKALAAQAKHGEAQQ